MFQLHFRTPIRKGSRYFLHAVDTIDEPFALFTSGLGMQPSLPVGTRLFSASSPTLKDSSSIPASTGCLFTTICNTSLPLGDALHSATGIWAVAEQNIPAGSITLKPHDKKGLSLAWVTLSDKGSQGLREDQSGPLINTILKESLSIEYSQGFMLPDAQEQLKELLTSLAIRQQYDLICTTGGTGVGPRDTTPEATSAIIDKRLHGFEQAMMQTSLSKTHNAVISRAVVGTLGNTLIINLPGSCKAVAENLGAILPAIAHTIKKLQGDTTDCGTV